MSNDTDFYTLTLPPFFNGSWDQVKDNWIRLKGPPAFSGTRFENNVIEVLSLRERYPSQVLGLDRKGFVAYFKTRGFQQISNADPCVITMKLVKPAGIFVVSSWGSGRGVILTGPHTGKVIKGLEAMTSSLQVAPGGCGWK
jgi:hypothetical protein